MDIERIAGGVSAWVEQQIVELSQPWSLYQLAMIAGCSLPPSCWRAGSRGGSRNGARRIKGHQGLLRVVVALMRRTKWIVFVGLLFLTLTILRAATWPSRSYLISIALSLALAWLSVSVLSRVIRNRLVARAIGMLAWIYAALVILGLDDEVAAFLDGLAVQLGAVRLTVLMAIKAFLLLSGTIWLAIVTGNYFDERLQQSEELTPSIRVLIGKIVKIGLVIFAGAASRCRIVGVDLTALTVLLRRHRRRPRLRPAEGGVELHFAASSSCSTSRSSPATRSRSARPSAGSASCARASSRWSRATAANI